MKIKEKEEARFLRKNQGLSIRQIAKTLKVSQSSASSWVKDIELSQEQKDKLLDQNPAFSKMTLYSRTLSAEALKKRNETYRERRALFQEEGKQRAQEKSWLHLMGCMLYWGEGSKGKNRVDFCNSDINMMKIFLKFLREEMGISLKEISFSINVYVNNGLSIQEIESFWLQQLCLPKECLRKSITNRVPTSSKENKKNKLIYGVGRISVSKTSVLQHILGAIQEYGNFQNKKWLY